MVRAFPREIPATIELSDTPCRFYKQTSVSPPRVSYVHPFSGLIPNTAAQRPLPNILNRSGDTQHARSPPQAQRWSEAGNHAQQLYQHTSGPVVSTPPLASTSSAGADAMLPPMQGQTNLPAHVPRMSDSQTMSTQQGPMSSATAATTYIPARDSAHDTPELNQPILAFLTNAILAAHVIESLASSVVIFSQQSLELSTKSCTLVETLNSWAQRTPTDGPSSQDFRAARELKR
jgi:hypothetical protein